MGRLINATFVPAIVHRAEPGTSELPESPPEIVEGIFDLGRPEIKRRRADPERVSAGVDPFGRIVEQLPVFQSGKIEASVVPFRSGTTSERWGGWFGMLCLILTFVIPVTRKRHLSAER